MYKIFLKDDMKLVRKPQRRLNPFLLEEVKKENTKLLPAGIIYPISDSKWVSPVQVVSKKSRLTMVANKDNELIPTQIQNSWKVCIDYRNLTKPPEGSFFAIIY